MSLLRDDIAQVFRPVPVLSRERTAQLTTRQREVLGGLSDLFEAGFAHLTMASIAAEMSCSLRLLYQIAPSRDELVEIVVDRNLWRVGRAASETIQLTDNPIDALRGYLRAANEAVSRTTPQFAADIRAVPGALAVNEAHERYLIDTADRLLEIAVHDGVIGDVDTAALALVLAGLGGLFASAGTIGTIRASPKETADSIVELVLRGLLSESAP